MTRVSLFLSLLAGLALAVPVLPVLPVSTADAAVSAAAKRRHHHHHRRHYRSYRYYRPYRYYYPYRYYRPYRYGYRYGYRGYSYPYRSYRYYAPRRDYVGSADQTVATPTAWQKLAEGNDSDALYLFGREAEADTQRAIPKVGFSLAAAGLGELDKSVWAMRRALYTDASSVHYAPIDEAVAARIWELVVRFEPQPSYDAGDMDDYFMLAALHYLVGDIPAADAHIRRAIEKADVSRSTANLAELIAAAGTESASSLIPES